MKKFRSVDIRTRLSWAKYTVCQGVSDFNEDIINPHIPQNQGMKILVAFCQSLLILFLFFFIIQFLFSFGGNVPQKISMPSPTTTYEEDFKDYQRNHADYYEGEIRDYKNREAQHYKDIKFVKAELDWLAHKIEDYRMSGQVIQVTDLQDLTQSVDKALNKFPKA